MRPGPSLWPVTLDRLRAKKSCGHFDMDAGAVAGLAVGIDRAAVPHRLQRIDAGRDDFAARLAVDRGDQADAAGIMLLDRRS